MCNRAVVFILHKKHFWDFTELCPKLWRVRPKYRGVQATGFYGSIHIIAAIYFYFDSKSFCEQQLVDLSVVIGRKEMLEDRGTGPDSETYLDLFSILLLTYPNLTICRGCLERPAVFV